MTYPKPGQGDLRAAFEDHHVPFRVHPKERGRDWSSGLRAATVHHTAGRNSADYLASAWRLPGANTCISNGRYNATDGQAVILAWGSCFHSGKGGPWRNVAAKDNLHLVSWGIEIESVGTQKDITDAQIQTVGRMLAALVDLGMPIEHIHRHADWTDGSGPVGGYPLSTVGRKIDTNARLGYTTDFWLAEARKYLFQGNQGDDEIVDQAQEDRIVQRVVDGIRKYLPTDTAKAVLDKEYKDFRGDGAPHRVSEFIVTGGGPINPQATQAVAESE